MSRTRDGMRLLWLTIILTVVAATSGCAPGSKQIAKLPEFKHHVEEMGSGQPVLMIHGFGGSTYAWRHLAKPISKTHRVILIDLKGYGKSPKPLDDEYDVHDQAALVCDFIRHHDLRDVTLVGNSFGGGVSLAILARLDDKERSRISRLILIDSVGYRQEFPGFISILRTPWLGSSTLNIVPATMQVETTLKTTYYNKDLVPDDAIEEYAKAIRTEGGRHALQKTAEQIIPEDIDEFVESYKKITIPTLIIWGRHDEVIPLEIGEKLHENIPGSRLEIIEECGHLPQEEKPEETLRLIRNFLTPKEAGP